jgi:hypothetical protein
MNLKGYTSDFLLTALISYLEGKFASEEELQSWCVSLDNLESDMSGTLSELSERSDVLPPLYCDAFRLPQGATCCQLAQKIRNLPEADLEFAVAFFNEMENCVELLELSLLN